MDVKFGCITKPTHSQKIHQRVLLMEGIVCYVNIIGIEHKFFFSEMEIRDLYIL